MNAESSKAPRLNTVWRVVLLTLICGLALYLRVSLRFGYEYVFFGDPDNGYPDSDAVTFNVHALNLVEGRGFGDYLKGFRSQNYIPPGHPLILGLVYFMAGNKPWIAGWFMAILGSLVPLFAYFWTRDMWGYGVGLIAAFLVAIHESYIRIGFTLMSEPSALFTTAVALWLGARLMRKPGWGSVAAAGLAFGFSALVRPGALAFMCGMVPWLFFAPRISLRRRMAVTLLFVLASMAPGAAWRVRNLIVHGKGGVGYTSISARHAWTAANPKDGPYFYSRDAWHETLWRDPQASEIDMIRRLQAETKQFIRADPLRYFFGVLWRMHLVAALESALRDKNHIIEWDYGGWTLEQTVALFLLGLVGFFRALRVTTRVEESDRCFEIPGGAWCLFIGVGLLLAVEGSGIYGASDRYRWPLEYALFPFAALAIYSLVRIASVDLVSRWTLAIRFDEPPAWMRRVRHVLAAVLGAVAVVYAAGLFRAHLRPERSADLAPVVTAGQAEGAVRSSGLWREFARQTPRWVTYNRVFEEQSRNYGAVTDLNGAVVVWWGRILYPYYFPDGRIRSAYVILEPKTGDFGGARLPFTTSDNASFGLTGIKDGDIVTLIARIDYHRKPLARPDLIAYGAIPGRFLPPGGANP